MKRFFVLLALILLVIASLSGCKAKAKCNESEDWDCDAGDGQLGMVADDSMDTDLTTEPVDATEEMEDVVDSDYLVDEMRKGPGAFRDLLDYRRKSADGETMQ